MFLFTFSLLSLFLLSSTTQSSWTQLSIDDCFHDQTIKDLLKFGTEYIIKQAIKEKSLQDNSYQISKILKIAQQILPDESKNYRFNLHVTNNQNDTKPASFLILHQTKTNTKQVTSFSIALGPANSRQKSAEDDLHWLDPVGGYQTIDLMELEEDQGLQDLLNFGLHYVIHEGIEEGLIPNGEYEITELFSMSSQVVSGINYDLKVGVSNGDGVFEKIDFVVFDQVWNGVKKVMDYDFLSVKK